METKITSFKEFYPFYLSQHANKTCRLLHVIGTTVVMALTLTSMLYLNPILLILLRMDMTLSTFLYFSA